jgi:hypothetical protein
MIVPPIDVLLLNKRCMTVKHWPFFQLEVTLNNTLCSFFVLVPFLNLNKSKLHFKIVWIVDLFDKSKMGCKYKLKCIQLNPERIIITSCFLAGVASGSLESQSGVTVFNNVNVASDDSL